MPTLSVYRSASACPCPWGSPVGVGYIVGLAGKVEPLPGAADPGGHVLKDTTRRGLRKDY